MAHHAKHKVSLTLDEIERRSVKAACDVLKSEGYAIASTRDDAVPNIIALKDDSAYGIVVLHSDGKFDGALKESVLLRTIDKVKASALPGIKTAYAGIIMRVTNVESGSPTIIKSGAGAMISRNLVPRPKIEQSDNTTVSAPAPRATRAMPSFDLSQFAE